MTIYTRYSIYWFNSFSFLKITHVSTKIVTNASLFTMKPSRPTLVDVVLLVELVQLVEPVFKG